MKSKLLVVILILTISVFIILGISRLIKTRPSDEPDTIIIISIDTIRADHLSSYGYQHETTPNIDAFANNAILFENCFANIPLTLPSHASMLTGVIPPTHGVQDNLTMRLPESALTLPEILRARGYSTYGIISAEVLNKRTGLSQGFDVYNDKLDDETNKFKVIAERSGDETVKHALKWLEENQHKKKFMFIHFFDPHHDYTPPAPYDKQFGDAYDGEIAFADHCTGQIIDKLKSLGLYDDSLIIITGDHGELLGEHGEVTHAFFIYQNVLRVPLIIKPVHHTRAVKVTDNTTLIDITPTILAQSGIEIPSHVQGVDLSDYFVRENHHIPDRFIFNESLTATKYNGNSLLGVINNQWHYIQTTRPELYNWIEDPEELNNLISQEPQRGRILQDHLRQILEGAVSTSNESSITLDAKSRAVLQSLGYVGGGVDPDFTFGQSKEDPKDLLKIHNTFMSILGLSHQKKHDEAIELCNQIISDRPDISYTYIKLVEIYVELKSYDKAIDVIQKQLALLPDDIVALKALVEIYSQAEDYPKAIDTINTILRLKPDEVGAYSKLAEIYIKLESYDQAIDAMQKRLAVLPEDIDSLRLLVGLYNQAEDYAKATDTLNTILKLKPDEVDVYSELAKFYMKLESYDQAIDAMQKRLAVLPEDIYSLKFLAEIYNRAGDYPKAIDTINTILKLKPDEAEAYSKLAETYIKLKSYDQAIDVMQRRLALVPEDIHSLKLLLGVYNGTENYPQAIDTINRILKLQPNDPEMYFYLARSHHHLNNNAKALENYLKVLQLNPRNLPAHISIAEVYSRMGKPKQSVSHYRQALRLRGNSITVLNNLAWILATDEDAEIRDTAEAVQLAERACQLTDYKDPLILDTLAVAYSQVGQFAKASETAEKAVKIAQVAGQEELAEDIQSRLKLYKAKRPYRE